MVGSRIYASRGLLLQCESLLEIATTIASLNGSKFIRVLVNTKLNFYKKNEKFFFSKKHSFIYKTKTFFFFKVGVQLSQLRFKQGRYAESEADLMSVKQQFDNVVRRQLKQLGKSRKTIFIIFKWT